MRCALASLLTLALMGWAGFYSTSPAQTPSAAPPGGGSSPGGGPVTNDSSVGYIDSAIPGTQVRIRYDSAYDFRRANRAEFFYAPGPPFGDGLLLPESNIDYQEASFYGEALLCERVSAFVELPWHFLNPEINANHSGFADMNAGFKWGFWADEWWMLTLQVKAYFASGEADRGLGNDHYSIEPGLLLFTRLDERWALEAELRHWIPIDGGAFAGSVLRYGVGLQYELYNDSCHWIAPVAEVVGWTVLDGEQGVLHPSGLLEVEDASGDTIVNLKLGVRFGAGCADFYAGYGRALTGDAWYENIIRFEFRLLF